MKYVIMSLTQSFIQFFLNQLSYQIRLIFIILLVLHKALLLQRISKPSRGKRKSIVISHLRGGPRNELFRWDWAIGKRVLNEQASRHMKIDGQGHAGTLACRTEIWYVLLLVGIIDYRPTCLSREKCQNQESAN